LSMPFCALGLVWESDMYEGAAKPVMQAQSAKFARIAIGKCIEH